MFVSESLNVNERGHLTISSCDTVELAKQYGTPLYVMDEALIRKNCRMYKNALETYYDGNGMVLYASKAFCTTGICKIIDEEGLGLDVVSGGELYTAMKAGFPPEKIFFHGNNKTLSEIEYAISCNIGRFVIDNEYELSNVEELAGKAGKKINAMLRITPGVDAHTHDFVMTGKIDSKFGAAIDTGAALQLVSKVIKCKNINLTGIHCHIGSQIFDLQPFEYTAEVMTNFIAEIKRKTGYEITELNLGGGFGIKYTPKDDPIEYDKYIKSVSKVIKNLCAEKGISPLKIFMEPGRSIVASSGITLYTVGSIKEIEGYRTYLAVDGGMPDNPRYALYRSEYDVVVANKANAKREMEVTVAGKCCESGDILQEHVSIAKAESGDILAVLATGAYNYSMSMNYNRLPRPAVVMVNNGHSRLFVKRETYEDLTRNDI